MSSISLSIFFAKAHNDHPFTVIHRFQGSRSDEARPAGSSRLASDSKSERCLSPLFAFLDVYACLHIRPLREYPARDLSDWRMTNGCLVTECE